MNDVEQGKACAILAWFFPIGLIWFFADEKMNKNKFVSFHVKQSLVFAIASILLNMLAGLIPIIGLIIISIGNLILFVFFIIGLLHAIKGEMKELPYIGGFAKQFKF